MTWKQMRLTAQLLIGALALAALVALAMSWMSRGQQIESLLAWQETAVRAITLATVEPDSKGVRKTLDPSAVPAAIAALKRSVDQCLAASAERDRIVGEAQARSAQADQALANVQALYRGEFASAERRIKALEGVQAQPTPELQCRSIAVDSRAAWEAWK